MRRPVIVWVDDPDVTHLDITHCRTDTDDWPEPVREDFVPAPPDDRLVRHLWNAVSALEAEASEERTAALMYGAGSSIRRKHSLRAEDAQGSADAIRAAFGLDTEDA